MDRSDVIDEPAPHRVVQGPLTAEEFAALPPWTVVLGRVDGDLNVVGMAVEDDTEPMVFLGSLTGEPPCTSAVEAEFARRYDEAIEYVFPDYNTDPSEPLTPAWDPGRGPVPAERWPDLALEWASREGFTLVKVPDDWPSERRRARYFFWLVLDHDVEGEVWQRWFNYANARTALRPPA